MKLIKNICIVLFFITTTSVISQTPGLNYQALILNSEEIQIPATNVSINSTPLTLEPIVLRFTIIDENGIEYEEEHEITTDQNGMVSVIVGQGSPTFASFNQIIWDGNPKDLNVEINILSQDNGFEFLDIQQILYIPYASNPIIVSATTINDLRPGTLEGNLAWVENYDGNENPTLVIWTDSNWVPVTNDFDPENEINLVTVADETSRDLQFENPTSGTQVWNTACDCLQIYNGTNWVSIANFSNDLIGTNGITTSNGFVKLGGTLIEPTTIATSTANTLAIRGLQNSTNANDEIVVVESGTNVLRKTSAASIVKQQQVIITAADGQQVFQTPQPISNINKIDVYRNGVRIAFTLINTSTIELEAEATCFAGDEIRIVQLN